MCGVTSELLTLGNENKCYENPLPTSHVSCTVYSSEVGKSGDGSHSPRCVISRGLDGK